MRKAIAQPADATKRVCTVCRVEKPLDGFYRSTPGSSDERTYGCAMPCKECNRARCRGYKRSDEQRARDAERAKRPDVAEQNRQRSAAWYDTERGKNWIRDYCAKRYEAHHEEIRAESRERYRTDGGAMREAARLSNVKRRARPEVRQAKNEAHAVYKKTDRGRLLGRMHRQLRRARIASTVCDLTDDQWLALVAAYGGRCAYCDKTGPMTIDHIEPLARGGAHTLRNVAPACKRCNQLKGALPPSDALAKLNVTRVAFLQRQGLALFTMIRGT